MTGTSATWTPRACPISSCRRFGIERPMPDMSRLPELYEGWDPQQRRQALDNIQDMSKQFGRSIDKSLEADKQRGRAPVRPCSPPCPLSPCGGVFPLRECNPPPVPRQGRTIAGAIVREPTSLRTGRALTGAVRRILRLSRGKHPKAASWRLCYTGRARRPDGSASVTPRAPPQAVGGAASPGNASRIETHFDILHEMR